MSPPRAANTLPALRGARCAVACLIVMAPVLPGCSKKAGPPTQSSPSPTQTAAAADAGNSLLTWAGDEPTAIVHTRDAVIARALDSRRSRVLWTGAATNVVLDSALDLVWVQGGDSLDVIDLRGGGDEVVAIARGLPTSVLISVMRTTDGGVHVSVPEAHCDTGRSLTLRWDDHPRLEYLDGETAGWVQPRGSTLVAASWLRAELARSPRAKRLMHREFSAAAPAVPLAIPQAKCAWDTCGRPIPFDGSGVQLVVTSFEQGDCVHVGCHLYDPASKKFGTPPMATAWGKLEDVAAGPCGVYHFDRTGKRFLIQTSLCVVGGKCQDLGGDAVGWLGEELSVGVEG